MFTVHARFSYFEIREKMALLNSTLVNCVICCCVYLVSMKSETNQPRLEKGDNREGLGQLTFTEHKRSKGLKP